MADIRIKDLATTATTTASDDFMAVDGVTNGTRKLSAATPAFLTSVTTPSLTAPDSNSLTLAGGSSGASLVLGQGANAGMSITPSGTGAVNLINSVNVNGVTGVGKLAVRTGTNENAHFRTATAIGGTGVGLDMLNDASSAVVGFTLRASATRLTGGVVSITDATAGSASAGALVVTGGLSTGADSFFGGSKLLTQKDQNAPTRLQVRNDTNGTGAQAQVSATLGDFTTYTAMGSLAAAFTTSGLFAANTGYIASNATAGLNIFTVGATSLTLGTNSTAALTLASGGAATFAGAVTVGGKITSAVSTATGYNQLYDTTGLTTGRGAFGITSTGAGLAFGVESSVGGTSFTGSTAYASYFGTTTATPIHFVTNSVIRQTIDSTGAATFAGAVTAASLATAQTAAAATSIVITHKIPITLNGTVYYMALTATP